MATVLRRTGSGAYYGKMTISLWVKRAKLGEQGIFGRREGSSTANLSTCHFTSDDQLLINFRDGGGNSKYYMITNRRFRDVGFWYHIVFAIDGTDGTAGDRSKLYINGVRETSFSLLNNPSSTGYEVNMFVGGSYHTYIARGLKSASDSWLTFEGCMSHIHCSTGYTYDASVFGSTDSTTGEWKINTSPSFTLGTDGFTILKDGNTITDQSSNSNDFSLYSGTLTKTEDNPSNVFCNFNNLTRVPSSSYSNGNTKAVDGAGAHKAFYGTLGFSSGKYYWEAKAVGGSKYTIGLSNVENYINYTQVTSTNVIVGESSNSYAYGDAIGWYYDAINKNGSTIASGVHTIATNDIMMVAADADAGKIYYGLNGTWRVANSTTFNASSNDTTFTTGKTYTPAFSGENCGWEVNWGNGYFGTTAVSSEGTNASGIGKFEYDVPTGFTALSTKGLNE